jgi:hypothetical protein
MMARTWFVASVLACFGAACGGGDDDDVGGDGDADADADTDADCTRATYDGDYSITDAASLEALAGYTRVNGIMTMVSTELGSVDGLECLREVNGDLIIVGNAALTSLSGLSGLMSTGGKLRVSGNAALGYEQVWPEQARQLEEDEYRGDFIALVYDELHSEPPVSDMVDLAALVGLRTVEVAVPDSLKSSPMIGNLLRSDHASFWGYDLPGIQITDTADFRYPEYHCRSGEDVVANLDHAFATRVVQITVGAAANALGLR